MTLNNAIDKMAKGELITTIRVKEKEATKREVEEKEKATKKEAEETAKNKRFVSMFG